MRIKQKEEKEKNGEICSDMLQGWGKGHIKPYFPVLKKVNKTLKGIYKSLERYKMIQFKVLPLQTKMMNLTSETNVTI